MKTDNKTRKLLRFEHQNEPLLAPAEFRARLLRFALLALALVAVWLLIGTVGFWGLAELPWLDAFYNASMIVSEMGPVFVMTTVPAKLFTAFYALVSGLVFLGVFGLISAPIVHRLFHRFHLPAPENADEQ